MDKTLEQEPLVTFDDDGVETINYLILKTGLKRKNVKVVKPLLDSHPLISRWCIDLDDIDNVLKIEAQDSLTEGDVILLVRKAGFYCEALPD